MAIATREAGNVCKRERDLARPFGVGRSAGLQAQDDAEVVNADAVLDAIGAEPFASGSVDRVAFRVERRLPSLVQARAAWRGRVAERAGHGSGRLLCGGPLAPAAEQPLDRDAEERGQRGQRSEADAPGTCLEQGDVAIREAGLP